MPHWTESLFTRDPDLFAPTLDRRTDEAPDQVSALLNLVERRYDRQPTSVLDVGCGMGRHVVAFAEAGVEAHGVDISEAYLERARERAGGDASDRATFERGDMRELADADGTYDLVTSFWTTFGYYGEETNQRVLEGMYDRVAEGGVVALELANREGVLSAFDADGVSVLGDEMHVETREYDPQTARMHTTVRVLDDESETYLRSFEFDVRLYAPVELAAMVARAGFSDVALYASLDGETLDPDSRRLVVLGRKPGDR
jgi:SAM-dependent methyltransferase